VPPIAYLYSEWKELKRGPPPHRIIRKSSKVEHPTGTKKRADRQINPRSGKTDVSELSEYGAERRVHRRTGGTNWSKMGPTAAAAMEIPLVGEGKNANFRRQPQKKKKKTGETEKMRNKGKGLGLRLLLPRLNNDLTSPKKKEKGKGTVAPPGNNFETGYGSARGS